MTGPYEYLYAVLSLSEWESVNANGRASCRELFDKHYGAKAGSYFAERIQERTSTDSSDFCYCFYSVPDNNRQDRHILCQVRVPREMIAPFDDLEFLQVVNDMLNDREDSPKMSFDKDYPCKSTLRAFIPELTRGMITRVQHFHGQKRIL